MQSDPISDMLTRIRNAALAHHKQVLIPSSRTKQAIAKILKDEGFIQSYDVTKDAPQPMLRLVLKYDNTRKSVLTGSKRISKPGRRVYSSRREIPLVYSGLGVAILSTPQGIMTGASARRAGIGGEVLCYVW